MGKLEINFNSPTNIFKTGETIHGFVYVRDIKIKSLIIRIKGKAKTFWTIRIGNNNSIPCKGEDIYLNDEHILFQGKDSNDILKPGEYRFPFFFVIPERCMPTTVETFGKVEYFCETEVQLPSFDSIKTSFLDKKLVKEFTVIPVLDLTKFQSLSRPLRGEFNEEIGKGIFRYGWLKIQVDIPRGGYISGEAVNLITTIENKSSKKIGKIKLELIKNVNCAAKYNGVYKCVNGVSQESGMIVVKKSSNKTILKYKEPFKIFPNSTESLTTTLQLPNDIPITTFERSPILELDYIIQITIFSDDTIPKIVQVNIPIVIGSIPIDCKSSTDVKIYHKHMNFKDYLY